MKKKKKSKVCFVLILNQWNWKCLLDLCMYSDVIAMLSRTDFIFHIYLRMYLLTADVRYLVQNKIINIYPMQT